MSETKSGTILFVHGASFGSWMWTQVVEHLPEFECLTPELPEHGTAAQRVFSLDNAVEALHDAVEGSISSGIWGWDFARWPGFTGILKTAS